LASGTGLRRGDIELWRVSDADFENNYVTTKSKKISKSMGSRSVPVPIMAEFKKYVRVYCWASDHHESVSHLKITLSAVYTLLISEWMHMSFMQAPIVRCPGRFPTGTESKDHARNNFPFCRPIARHLWLFLNRRILIPRLRSGQAPARYASGSTQSSQPNLRYTWPPNSGINFVHGPKLWFNLCGA